VTALYFGKRKINSKNPNSPERDRFILNKKYSVLSQYVALAEMCYFPKPELKTTNNLGSIFRFILK